MYNFVELFNPTVVNNKDIMDVIIPRNTPVPTKLSKDYTTVSDNQTYINIKVFEGENKMSVDNHLLGEFVIEGIPPKRRGVEKIIVTFNLSEEGILYVKAKIKNTGGENEIKITENKGRLTQKMIDDIMNEVMLKSVNIEKTYQDIIDNSMDFYEKVRLN